MTVQQLKYIVTLDEERHFGRAAEKCSVTQPGLTIQLKSLEEEIGLKIFDRSRVPLKPTPLGEEIITRAKKVLREIDGIRNYVVQQKNIVQGPIRLGVVSTLSPYLVPRFIDALEQATPQIEYFVREASTVQLMTSLETGTLDIALMATPTGNSNLMELPVFNEPFLACLNSSHAQADNPVYKLNDNDKLELLMLNSEYCYNAQLLDICNLPPHKTKRRSTFEINSIEMLKNMVRADMGFAIVPALSVIHEPKQMRFKPFKDPQPVREISLVVADTFAKKQLLETISATIWQSLPPSLKGQLKYKKIKWDDSPYFAKMTS